MRGLAANRALWAAVAVILVIGPAVFTVLRASEFSASVEMTPIEVGPFPEVTDPAYYTALSNDRVARFEVERAVGVAPAPSDVRFTREPETGELVLTVTGRTPREAYDLVHGFAHQVSQASRRQLAAEVQQRLAILEPLDSTTGRGALRRRLDREVAELEDLGALPPARVIPDRPGAVPEPERAADKLVDALPGTFPGRPSPVWAGFAGLIVTATLWGIAFVLGRRRDPR
jgi:hypothetical protein